MSIWTVGFLPAATRPAAKSTDYKLCSGRVQSVPKGAHCWCSFKHLSWYAVLESRLTRSEASSRESKGLCYGCDERL